MQTANDWGSAVVVDPRLLSELQESNTSLSTSLSRTQIILKTCLGIMVAGCAFSATMSYRQANHISRQASYITDLSAQVQRYRRSAHRSDVALGALAHSHENILAATAKAPSIGSESWGHRFTVTQYTARSAALDIEPLAPEVDPVIERVDAAVQHAHDRRPDDTYRLDAERWRALATPQPIAEAVDQVQYGVEVSKRAAPALGVLVARFGE